MHFTLSRMINIRDRIFLMTIFIFSLQFSFGQGWFPMGSRSHALGNASVAIDDIWAYHHNPANLVSVNKLGLGLSYENRF